MSSTRSKEAALAPMPGAASPQTPRRSHRDRVADAAEALIKLAVLGFEIRRVDFGGTRPVIWVAPSKECDRLGGVLYRQGDGRGGARIVRAAPFLNNLIQIQWEELH